MENERNKRINEENVTNLEAERSFTISIQYKFFRKISFSKFCGYHVGLTSMGVYSD